MIQKGIYLRDIGLPVKLRNKPSNVDYHPGKKAKDYGFPMSTLMKVNCMRTHEKWYNVALWCIENLPEIIYMNGFSFLYKMEHKYIGLI